jgi:hypothetical protein
LTKQKITAFAGLVIFSTFFFYLLGFFGGIGLSAREEGFLTIVLFPLSFVYFLYGKNLLFRFFGFVNFVMGIFLMNFESFSLASTFLLSSLIFGFLLLFSNKEIHIKGKGILNIVKSLWKLLFGTVVLFTVFFLSVLNSVSTYTNVQFQKFTSGFEVGHASLSEWLFGGTLVSATGSLFADILAGYGLFGITGFAVLILLVLYFSFRNLSLVEESDKKVINLASIFMILSFIFFMLQESVNALAVVVLWIVFVLVGSIATEHKFAQSFETIKIQKFGKKEKIIKAVSIVVTALLTVVLLSWARNIIV